MLERRCAKRLLEKGCLPSRCSDVEPDQRLLEGREWIESSWNWGLKEAPAFSSAMDMQHIHHGVGLLLMHSPSLNPLKLQQYVMSPKVSINPTK